MVADPAGHRWEVVSAAETGEQGCATWQVGPRLGPARRADELVAGQGLRRLPVSRAACGGAEERALMVRAVADRAFLPAKNLFEQVGNMMILTGKTMTPTSARPTPTAASSSASSCSPCSSAGSRWRSRWSPFGFGAPGLQAANFLSLFGALDRLGGFFILASVREFAPFVSAIIVAGVAGTAITADLGARKIREELDALQVLGVDPIKNLVVPRFLALMLITGLLDVYAIALRDLRRASSPRSLYGQPLGGFFATLFNNASVTDLWGSILKCTTVRRRSSRSSAATRG